MSAPLTAPKPELAAAPLGKHFVQERGRMPPEPDILVERLHGREFVGSTAYPLPAGELYQAILQVIRLSKRLKIQPDHAEHDRLDIQHIVSRTTIDGLYVSKDMVKHALREDQLGVPSVLDIGTGSGRWQVSHCIKFYSHGRSLKFSDY